MTCRMGRVRKIKECGWDVSVSRFNIEKPIGTCGLRDLGDASSAALLV